MNGILKIAKMYQRKLSKVAQEQFDPYQFDENKYNKERELVKGEEDRRLSSQLSRLAYSASLLAKAVALSAYKWRGASKGTNLSPNDMYDDMDEESAISQYDDISNTPENLYDYPGKSTNSSVGNSLIEQGVLRDSKKVETTAKYLLQLFKSQKLTKGVLKNTLRILQSAVKTIQSKSQSIGDESVIVSRSQDTLSAIAEVEPDNLDPFYPEGEGGYSIDKNKSS